jgi:uncharacterized membrane protein YozB (DUF420 family)
MRGFLGTDAPFMMDVVVVSLIAVVPLLVLSIVNAKQGNMELHRKFQWILTITLGVAVVLFEAEMRLVGGIANIMPIERYTLTFRLYLWLHIAIAVTTLVMWVVTLRGAKSNYEKSAMKGDYGSRHRMFGYVCALSLVLTSVTGLGVYGWCFL